MRKKIAFSKRVLETQPSPIRKLAPFAQRAKEKGIKVYHLNIGQPDIKTPKEILAPLKSFNKKIIRYCHSQGEEIFVKALLRYYHHLGFKDLTSENILVTTGGSEAILFAFLAVADVDEEILVFEPFYANYNGFANMAQVKLVPILTSIENGFHFPPKKEIEKKITARTRAILINNPNNPTGTVYTQEELENLVDLAKKHNLFLLSDEVYREFVYQGRHFSVLEFKKIRKQAILLDSLSKRLSLCGARLGCFVSYNQDLVGQVLKFAQARLSSPFLEQVMAAQLIKIPRLYFENVQKEYQARMKIVFQALKKIPGVSCYQPEGAFYLLAKLPIKDSEDFAKWLLTDFQLKKETVMVAPAAGFYASKGKGRDEIRIAYVLSQRKLKRAMEILKKGLETYSKA